MKALKLQPTGTLLLVFLGLILHTLLFGQSNSKGYHMESDRQAITSHSLPELQRLANA
jgi:hypothetical protein